MAHNNQQTLPAVGFLTIVEDGQFGFLGGYLVLNIAGRPIEFHCTAPIQPTRAQQILYGPTLRPFLFAEQIGPALLERPKTRPLFVCTDVSHFLAIRPSFDAPIVWLRDSAERRAGEHAFMLGSVEAAVLAGHAGDEQPVAEQWRTWLVDFDLQEPFARIREAIQEAQRSVRPAA